MASFAIGVSGLYAAQRALDVIGNNIANAATEGYHRQRVDLAPAYSSGGGAAGCGGGVDVANVVRIIDRLLEDEIIRQGSSLGQISEELSTLSTIEDAFGELSEGSSLSATMDEFFNALRELSAHPMEAIWQNQAVTAGETLAGQFRTLGEFLKELDQRIFLEAENIVSGVNTLINQIAELNGDIQRVEVSGGDASNLRDQRDQRIAELSELVGVETRSQEGGVVDVSIGGIPVVTGSSVIELWVGVGENGYTGIASLGAHDYRTSVQGGQLGGLLALRNELVREIRSDLDALALAIMRQINQYHVQGVGSDGSFTELTGCVMPSEDLADSDAPVNDGKIYIRVTNTATGETNRYEVEVDISGGTPDTLTTVATKIDAVEGLSASVVSSRLHVEAESGYKFDFLPAVLPEPTTSNFTATSPPAISVSGIYTGTENQTFTLTVEGTGSVGNGNLQLEVRNGAGEVVTRLDVGAGYPAGDKLDIGSGIKVSLSSGDLNTDDSLTIDVFANTDTSGVLAAAGINTFFYGTGAADMVVCSDIVSSPGRVAAALGSELSDNGNALRLADLRDQSVSSLDAMTPGEFYRRLVTTVGEQVEVKQARCDNVEAMIQNLDKRQSDISGVNINDEAAQMLIFEQMFQAMGKYMRIVQSMMVAVMDMV